MVNDLWLMLLGPVLIAGVCGFVWLFDRFFGDCQHKWGIWEREPDTDFAMVQSRVCKKCQMHQIHQARKMGKGS